MKRTYELLDSLNMDDFVQKGKDISIIMDEIVTYLDEDIFDMMETYDFVCYLRSRGYWIYEQINYYIS